MKEEAERCGQFYVNARWLGGMLTNFKTMRRRIDRLNQLKKMEEDGTFNLLPKKEVVKLKLEIEKLEKYLGGVKEMKRLPGALSSTPGKKRTPSPRPASWACPLWRLWIPTATPTRWIM